MFDLGWSEILVIAIVMIVVVGPKDLPRVLRSFGRTTSKLRAMAGDFRRQFDEALKEAELDDVKTLVDDVRKFDPRNEIRKHLNPLEQATRDIKSDLDAASRTMPSPTPSTSTSAQEAAPLKAGPSAMPGETMPASTSEAAASKVEVAAAPASTPAEPVKAETTKPKAAKKAATKKAPAETAADVAETKPKAAPRSKKKIGSDAQ